LGPPIVGFEQVGRGKGFLDAVITELQYQRRLDLEVVHEMGTTNNLGGEHHGRFLHVCDSVARIANCAMYAPPIGNGLSTQFSGHYSSAFVGAIRHGAAHRTTPQPDVPVRNERSRCRRR
jgi:hypothetical protein